MKTAGITRYRGLMVVSMAVIVTQNAFDRMRTMGKVQVMTMADRMVAAVARATRTIKMALISMALDMETTLLPL